MQETFAKVPAWAKVDVLNQAAAAQCYFAPLGASGDWFEAEMALGQGVEDHSAMGTQQLDWALVASMKVDHLGWVGGWVVQVILWVACAYSVKMTDDNCKEPNTYMLPLLIFCWLFAPPFINPDRLIASTILFSNSFFP